jgi:probable rRNA maturation factor
MEIDILFEDPRWDAMGLSALADTAVAATLARLGLDPAGVALSVLACDDARIAALNADFRGKPAPTNVLSWPAEDRAADVPGAAPEVPQPDPDGTVELGDLALAYQTCVAEAEAQQKAAADHVTHLIVHGTLHLLGYDHESDADAALMEGLEREILGKMGLDDPYM